MANLHTNIILKKNLKLDWSLFFYVVIIYINIKLEFNYYWHLIVGRMWVLCGPEMVREPGV